MNNEQRIEQVFYGVDFFRKKKCCRQAKSSKVFLQKKLSAGRLNLRKDGTTASYCTGLKTLRKLSGPGLTLSG